MSAIAGTAGANSSPVFTGTFERASRIYFMPDDGIPSGGGVSIQFVDKNANLLVAFTSSIVGLPESIDLRGVGAVRFIIIDNADTAVDVQVLVTN